MGKGGRRREQRGGERDNKPPCLAFGFSVPVSIPPFIALVCIMMAVE